MHNSNTVSRAGAIGWYLWRLGRTDLFARGGILLAGVVLCGLALPEAFLNGPSSLVLQSVALLIIVELCVVSRFAWGTLEPDADHSLISFFVQPVSTRQYVYLRCIFVVGTGLLLFLIACLLLRWLAMPELPLAGPALSLVVLTSILNVSLVAPATLLGRVIGLVVGMLSTFGWFGVLYWSNQTTQPFLFVAGEVGFYPPTLTLVIVAVSLFLLCTEVCVKGVAIQRRGDIWPIESLVERVWASVVGIVATAGARFRTRASVLEADAVNAGKAFRSSWTAQAWYEYRTSGTRVLYFGGVIAVLLLLSLSVAIWLNPQSQVDVIFWPIGIALSPLMFQLAAADAACGLRREGPIVTYSSFHAARPIGNAQLLKIKLFMIAIHTLIGFAIVCVAACLFFSIFGWSRIPDSNLLFELWTMGNPWVFISVLVVIPAAFIINAAMTMRLGFLIANRPRLFWTIAMVSYLHVIALFILNSRKWLHPEYWQPYFYALAGLIAALAIWNIAAAFGNDRSGLKLRLFGLVAWLATLQIAFIEPETLREIPPAVLVFGSSVTLVPLLAFVSLPNALAKQRHG